MTVSRVNRLTTFNSGHVKRVAMHIGNNDVYDNTNCCFIFLLSLLRRASSLEEP